MHGPVSHQDVELAWVEEGALTYEIGARTLELTPGSAVVIPAGVEHSTRVAAGTSAGSVWLDRELVDGTACSLGQRTPEPSVMEDAELVVRLGGLLRTEVELHRPGWPLAVDTLGEAIVVAMLRRGPRPATAPRSSPRSTPRDARISAAMDRIEEDYAESLSVEDLARTAGMSRFHFSRRFREEVGESPYKFLVRVRVERAAACLRAGRSVTEAAYEVGFGGLGRFSRAFRARYGVLPSRYSA